MNREKKLVLNTYSSLLYEIISLVYGFVVPQLVLQCYGSAVNGLVSSITHFLGFISLAECGVGAVVRSTLYGPLANKDNILLSKIVKSSNNFFKKIGLLLLGYTTILVFLYPLTVKSSFSYAYIATLVIILSIVTFSQYYFSMTYRLLLAADQLIFVQMIVQSITLILNLVISFIAVRFNLSIHIYKFLTSVFFLIQPIIYMRVVKSRYKIDYNIAIDQEPIKQKWNGLAQHIATVILVSTDTIVLTLFSKLEDVSVYAVYNIVVSGIKSLVTSFTNGMQALLGNMYVKKEFELLEHTFASIEWLVHSITTFAYTCCGILIVPFVTFYTKNITDVSYIVPSFAILITIAQAMYSYRIPYNMMVLAVGHYKQTQNSAIIEASINLLLSIFLVIKFGLVGVTIGTLVAMSYRTIYFALYLKKNILKRSFRHFIKHMLIDLLSALIIVICTLSINLANVTYIEFFLMAIKVAFIAFTLMFVINFIFYKNEMKSGIALLIGKK